MVTETDKELWRNELKKTEERIEDTIRNNCSTGMPINRFYSENLCWLAGKAAVLRNRLKDMAP